MKLYFENSLGKKRLLKKVKSEKEALEEINRFCEERGFEIFYIRSWNNDKGDTTYDVGSHTEFFILNR